MTCIVGIANEGKVYMGGDSAITRGDVYAGTFGKVFSGLESKLIIGVCGSLRISQVTKLAFSSDNCDSSKIVPGDEEMFMTRCFVDALRDSLGKAGCLGQKDGEEYSARDTAWLVGVNGRLFYVDGYFGVGERADGFDAVGSGARYAMGWLYGHTVLGYKPVFKVEGALKAAAYFDEHVRPPFRTCVLEESDAE